MDRKTAILLAAIIICMFPVAGYAEPTVSGPTGLFVNPTADTAPMNHMWVGINFIDLDTIILPDQTVEGGTAWTGVLTGGLSDNFEIGLGFMLQEESNNGLLFNGKYKIIEDLEGKWYPAVALGAMVSEYSGERTADVYLAASKFFWLTEAGDYGGSFHAGLNYLKPRTGEWDLQYFIGMDVSFSEEIVAIAEWSPDEKGFGDGFVYGMRYFFNEKTTGQVGFIDGDLTIGGSYIF